MVRANATSQAETIAAQDHSATTQEPPTLTFAQLKELIEQGRTDEIPNNKKIPDILSVCSSFLNVCLVFTSTTSKLERHAK